jgi:tetratricopeptide (TPR) repeat protein
MIKTAIAIACSITLFCGALQAQGLKVPAPSPAQTIKQDFGLGNIELSYSRPSTKGRKIFGDLVPFDKVWRTGANSATTINFSDDVIIGGKNITAGKYGLLSIPGKSEWTLILTKQLDVTSPSAYKQDQDVVRVQVKPVSLKEKVETFLMQFDEIKGTECNLWIMWDKTAVALPIKTDIDGKVMAQIETAMKSEKPPYFNAAMYYMETGKDLKQAHEWLKKAAETSPKAFWVWHQKANVEAKLGMKQDAIASANTSLKLAQEAQNPDYVALNEKLLKTLK